MLNTITIMGRLTRDPELRRTGNGVAVTNFSVAVDRDYSQNGVKETDFIDCVAWRQTGEFVDKYFSKGKLIVVHGRLEIRSWTDKDGNKRRTAEINATNVYFGEGRRDSNDNATTGATGMTDSPFAAAYAQAGLTPSYANDFAMLDDDDEQLPF